MMGAWKLACAPKSVLLGPLQSQGLCLQPPPLPLFDVLATDHAGGFWRLHYEDLD